MLEKAVEYIRANPSMILWVLVILAISVIYLYYVAYIAHGEGFTKKKGGKKGRKSGGSKKKRRDDDEEDAVDLNDDLPEPEETNARISRDRLDELSML